MDDLVYTTKVSLVDALCAKPVMIETLDGRNLKITLDEVITPKTVKVVIGEGMPMYDPLDEAGLEPVQRGNLKIKFRVIFPNSLDEK